jgi:hypothetical protein
MSVDLSQGEADELIAMPKECAENRVLQFPIPGERLVIPLVSTDRTEDFLLDVTRSRIDLVKITYQNRGRVVVVLLRLDLNGSPHRNPDGEQIQCPHLHVYREGYGDKWAFPVPQGRFMNLENMTETLSDFMNHCNVAVPPTVQAVMF